MLGGARILIVEDEPLIAMDLALVIEDAGGVVAASVRSVKDAHELLNDKEFHAAVLDVQLPDGTAFEIAPILETKGIPFVFCTGDNDDPTPFSRWPESPVLTKPYEADLMVMALVALLENRGN